MPPLLVRRARWLGRHSHFAEVKPFRQSGARRFASCPPNLGQIDHGSAELVAQEGQGVAVAVEAAVEMSWNKYLGFEGRFVGMHGYGASGKIGDVYKKFDITTEAVVRAAKDVVREVHA